MIKKFLGQEVEKKKNGAYVCTTKQLNAIKEDHGVTKDMRSTVRKSERIIAEAAMEALGAEVIKTKKTAVLELGSGDGAKTFTMKAHTEGRNPHTREKVDSYGSFSYRTKVKTPGDKEFKEAHSAMRDKIKAAVLGK